MKQLRYALLLLLPATALHANLIRVNNNPDYATAYTTLTAAVAAANSGDTIYVEPSPTIYDNNVGTIGITKKLVIVGNGFFLGYNPGLQVRSNDSQVWPDILFQSGSQGSVITGINIQNTVSVLTDNITIKRCAINRCYVGYYAGTGQQVNTTQTRILESFLWGPNDALNSDNSVNNTALIIQNNIFDFAFGNTVRFSAGDQGIFENNTVRFTVNFNNSVFNFVNNLVQYGLNNYSNISADYNTCSCTSDFPTGANNTSGVPWSSLFLSGGSGDQAYRIDPAGPAANTGYYGNDDDRGALNNAPGRSSYRLGAVPEFPSIYKLLGGGSVNGSSFDIKISARSNN